MLDAFGLNSPIDLSLSGLTLGDLGFGTLLGTGLGTELSNLGLLSGLLGELNGLVGGVLPTKLSPFSSLSASLRVVSSASAVLKPH